MTGERKARVGAVIALVLSSVVLLETLAGAPNGTSTTQNPVTPLLLARALGTRTVYVVGSGTCAKSTCLQLYRTNDGDTRYTLVAMPPVSAIANQGTGSLERLVFANASDGYALEGAPAPTSLYATTNGATTWHPVKIPTGDSVYGFTVTRNALYAVFAHCTRANQACRDYRLVHSTLGATHWTGVSIPVAQFYDGGFVGTIGAAGGNVWLSEQPTGRPLLLISHNGGGTFAKSWPSRLASVSGCNLTAESSQRIWAECPTGMMVAFHYSSDAGRGWANIPQTQFFGTGGGFFAPITETFAYIDYGGAVPNIYRINVPANRETPVGELACTNVASAVFVDILHGLAICVKSSTRSYLERTEDGGATWQRVGLPSH
jgi:hypothetical protein